MKRLIPSLLSIIALFSGAFLHGATTRTHRSEHPEHATFTEMRLNSQNGCWEVALQVAPEDLEQALRWRTGTRVILGPDDSLAPLVAEYLRETFVLVDANGQICPLRWVGMDVDVLDAWLYFELPVSTPRSGCVLRPSMFFELQDDQQHTLLLEAPSDQWRASVQCTLDRSRVRLTDDGAEPVRPTAPQNAPASDPNDTEPRALRDAYDELIDRWMKALATAAAPDDPPLDSAWCRNVLDAVQRVEPTEPTAPLDRSTLRLQLAVVQALTLHADAARPQFERARRAVGSVEATRRGRTVLREVADEAERTGRTTLAKRLRSLASSSTLSL